MAQVLRGVVGATFQEPLTITDRDGTPTNLTGAAITWLAKAREDDADVDAILTASTAAGTITITDAVNGLIAFAIPAATMAAVAPRHNRNPWDYYSWTLEVFVGGVVTRYPDAFQGGPGKLLLAPSMVVAVPS